VGRIVTAILFTALLLSSIIAAAASPQKRWKTSSSPSHMSNFTDNRHGLGKAERNQLRDRARQAIDEASETIAEAKRLLEEAKESGLPTSMMEELLDSAEQLLERAKQLLDEAPQRALSMAMHAKSLAKMVINGIERLLRSAAQVHANRTSTESRRERFREALEDLMREALELRLRLSNLTRMNLNVSRIQSALNETLELINETLSSINAGEVPANIEEVLKEVEKILNEVEDEIESMLETTTAVKPSTTHIHVEKTYKTSKTSMRSLTTTKTFGRTSKAHITTTTATLPNTTITIVTVNVTKTHPRIEKFNLTTKPLKLKGINVTVTSGKKAVRIEHYMTLEAGGGGVSIVKETLITIGNKTIIRISKEVAAGNRSAANEIVIEKNQTVIGALVEVGRENASQMNLDLNLSVKVLSMEKNRLRLRVEAPNGTSGRILVIQLKPDTLDLNSIKEFKVLVNGREAVLASSILDLASEVYQEPAYVFVISSRGASVLLYIPHFSGYTIEILGVIEAIESILTDALSKALTRDLLITSTIAATIIAFTIAIGQVRRKERIRRI